MLPSDAPGAENRRDEGIEFLIDETNEPYVWIGSGSGEKGYRWTDVKSISKSTKGDEPSS
jgi:hypothetical protein